MSTQKQIEANRLNAQKSTGPRTADGKAASSRNAITHGLCSQFAVIPGEDPEAFSALLEELRAEHQPQTATEDILVEQMATAHWQRRRVAALEQAAWRNVLCESDPEPLLRGFIDRSPLLESLARHAARLERTFHRALHELQRLQAERRRHPEPPRPDPPSPEPRIPAPESEFPPKRTQFDDGSPRPYFPPPHSAHGQMLRKCSQE